uniref:RING-type domain-containing protein n=1 Tax=Chromera velia CCMP2878 TaxID=1169474 RepID=A0A0G4HU01_9ALVE|eukprot:Cvel_31600.t1-p1 / transcript=Cvel_31600.t1 / gene=Cvel_31600 / organism=Chromera_velia_CCMP2878 / gene_product=hypothetical protein / transcript_product=hypothetical protein / location=Cvel_scaffold4741:2471-6343(-) / protein_length=533 / sequence_SO=supercontig / SO=protein_coding / is_pseudo=false
MSTTASIHAGIVCDGCGTAPIKRNRFRCLQCPNTDFCEVCQVNHPKSHSLLLLKESVDPSWNQFFDNAVLADTQTNAIAMKNPMPSDFLSQHTKQLQHLMHSLGQGQALQPDRILPEGLAAHQTFVHNNWKRAMKALKSERQRKGLLDGLLFAQIEYRSAISTSSSTQSTSAFPASSLFGSVLTGTSNKKYPKMCRFTEGPPAGLVLVSKQTGFPLCSLHVVAKEAPSSLAAKKKLPGFENAENAAEFFMLGGVDGMEFGFVFTNLCREGRVKFGITPCGADGKTTRDMEFNAINVVRPCESVIVDKDALSNTTLVLRQVETPSGPVSVAEELEAPVEQAEALVPSAMAQCIDGIVSRAQQLAELSAQPSTLFAALVDDKPYTSDVCVLCLENSPPLDAVLLPCGHQCMHFEETERIDTCPMCSFADRRDVPPRVLVKFLNLTDIVSFISELIIDPAPESVLRVYALLSATSEYPSWAVQVDSHTLSPIPDSPHPSFEEDGGGGSSWKEGVDTRKREKGGSREEEGWAERRKS